jgi:hypothetical protein
VGDQEAGRRPERAEAGGDRVDLGALQPAAEQPEVPEARREVLGQPARQVDVLVLVQVERPVLGRPEEQQGEEDEREEREPRGRLAETSLEA